MNATAPGPTVVQQSPEKQTNDKKTKGKTKPKEKGQREARPARTLPTERIAFEKQLDILRAFAAASAQGTKAATIDEVAAIVKMMPATVAMGNPFFTSIGLISKTDAGYLPSADVVNFLRAYEWNRETASYKLAPTMEAAWFYQALSSHLSFRPMEEAAAVTALAEAASAGPDYKKSLQILIEYLIVAGLVQRDGNQLRLVRQTTPLSTEPAHAGNGKPADVPAPEPQAKPRILTGLAQTAEGAVHFNVQVRVEMAEFAGWKPERITAFFSGIAEVLKAKANVEKEVVD